MLCKLSLSLPTFTMPDVDSGDDGWWNEFGSRGRWLLLRLGDACVQ